MYKSVLLKGRDEFETKKSIFIGYSAPVSSEEEAIAFIDQIKKIHYDATHNCSAYIIGENRNIQRFDDDGEPTGTAGIPILEVLKRESLTNIVVVVTRYFGGTLLGGGGLIRAYSKGAKIAVDAGIIVDMLEYNYISLKYDYVFHGKIMNFVENNNFKILETVYTNGVELRCLIAERKLEGFLSNIREITSDNFKWLLLEERIEAEINGELANEEDYK